MTSEESELLAALRRADDLNSTTFAEMFEGAIAALGQNLNPQRIQQAAHSLRELLEKLPLGYLGAPNPLKGQKAGQAMTNIADGLDRARTDSSCYDRSSNRWHGTIDGPLERLLVRVEEAVTAHRSILTRREVNRRFLRHLDPLGGPLPDEDQILDELKERQQFFQEIAHHRRVCDDPEFRSNLDATTRLLRNQLKTATLEVMEALDNLIEESE